MDEVDKAREWLIHNAEKRAEAKAHRTYCEEYKKSLKAILFNEAKGTIAERENYAYSHEKYLDHLNELQAAVLEDEKLKALAAAAEMKISMWQTHSANIRGARL